jgi:hypothetical protein
MKIRFKLALLSLVALFAFTSCKSYKIMHYSRDEIVKINDHTADYKIYIDAKDSLFSVTKANLSIFGVKGNLTLITDKDTIAAIKNPRTRQELIKHQHDLNIYTKAKIKDNPNEVVLKKADIIDVTHIVSKNEAAEAAGVTAIFGVGVLVWIIIIKSTQGLL